VVFKVSRNSLFSVITFGFLAIATTSCGGDASKPTKSDAPQAAANASPAPAPASSFTQPIVAGTNAAKEAEAKAAEMANKPNGDVVAGLLPASDSDSVVRSTAKGRTDPFSGVTLPVVETKTTKTNSSTTMSTTSTNKTIGKGGTIAFTPRTIAAGSNSSTGMAPSLNTPTKIGKLSSGLGAASVANLAKKNAELVNKKPPANEKPTPSTIAIKPVPFPSGSGAAPSKPSNNDVAIRDIPAPAPIPQPELARAIFVSGVSQVNGQTQVILKLPNESFSRYVSVGERVMNGQVLVKRVQEFSGLAPVVILEEVGIEVSRKIGDKPVVASNEAKK
jgi:hypothetical protein